MNSGWTMRFCSKTIMIYQQAKRLSTDQAKS
jgi:hypothetical protein